MVLLSMDGPNVNLKLLKKLKEQIKELESPGLIDFRSCNLHIYIVHSGSKSSADVGGWHLKKCYSPASSF